MLGAFKELKFEMAEVTIMIQKISNSMRISMEILDVPDVVKEQAMFYLKQISLLKFHSEVIDDFFVILSPSLTNRVNSDLLTALILRHRSVHRQGVFLMRTHEEKSAILGEVFELSKLITLQEMVRE